jgi:chromate transporter
MSDSDEEMSSAASATSGDVVTGVVDVVVDGDDKVAVQSLPLLRLFALFLGFGVRAWGGPVVQIDMMREYFVTEAKWVSSAQFNRALAVYQVLPGPEAHELCCYFGMLSRGRIGSVLAGLGFMLPGLCLMLLFSWLYDAFYRNAVAMNHPDALKVQASFRGIQACVTALVIRAVHRLGTQALSNSETKRISAMLVGCAFCAAIASVIGINFFIPLGVGGVANAVYEAGHLRARAWLWTAVAGAVLVLSVVGYILYRALAVGGASIELGATDVATNPPEYWALFVIGLLAGLVTFGGAYTTIPYVRAETLVFLPTAVFLDAIALAQVIPSPLVMFVCFVGYMGRGIGGALLMTLGVFLPSFSFTLIGHSLFERAVKLSAIRTFLDGVTAAVIGLVAFTAIELVRDSVAILPGSILIFAIALGALYTIVSVWTPPAVILASAIAGQVLCQTVVKLPQA